MITKELLSIIASTRFWNEECPASIILFTYIVRGFVQQGFLGRKTLQRIIVIFKDGQGYELTPYQEKKDIFTEIYENEKKRPGYFKQLISRWDEITGQVKQCTLELSQKELKNYNDQELAQACKQFQAIALPLCVYGTFFECIDPFTETLAEQIQHKYRLSKENAGEQTAVLSTPNERSFLTQEKVDFLRTILGEMSISEFQEKYFWFESNYKEAPPLTKQKIQQMISSTHKSITEIQQEIKEVERHEKFVREQKNKLRATLTTDDRILFDLIAYFAHVCDTRKEMMLRCTFVVYALAQEVARRRKIPLATVLLMELAEAIELLEGKKLDLRHIKSRKKGVVFYWTPAGDNEFINQDAEHLYGAVMQKLLKEDFKGNVTFNPGTPLQGKVCKVLDTKRDHFEPGSILVTTMTRPDFMHIMRQAKAVITDEGGITCHASIVSRELKIPCIIGTKVATKLLSTGDVIEMDFVNGTVTKK